MQRNKILKETKIIPRVVFEIEQFHNEVLSLDKKTGVSIYCIFKKLIYLKKQDKFLWIEATDMCIYLGSTWNLHKAQYNARFSYKKHAIGGSTGEHEYKHGKKKKWKSIV